ncbi:glycosyl transferase [Cylindrospermopsis raciborskii S07]|uniref:glycosyltransferase family 2 protein n=1 Tax=Cylindrospermopsis raciborskii TaxID=77022 RepID=UPI000C9E5911|nr:glycosyltransferase [Cylindrospermopsis raciborskii]PNK05538.1 glycosyl transferase [Cylindrospermopsis raciborskii S10]PNK08664.1 glycosyl transferase [Cylindrospermopsis raciborskii S07]PNK10260.1 glycosyl transferase [Cylindrospermopsis raciborskii S14]PNK15143.1 glycosyl transferase [Cylindrospermopsis raciborskii S06]PNK17426.1 glycosyl transferase [Cylindrospermopsis raciborskii S05]
MAETTSAKVSVIIPTYNRADVLNRCLLSLVSQTYKNFEVLVCDDGSTDNTQAIVESFLDKLSIYYFKDENFGGPARPRNIGVTHASGYYLAFLDSDDWWTPWKLEKSVQALESGVDFIYHSLHMASDRKYQFRIRNKIYTKQVKSPVFYDLLLKGNPIPNSSVVVKRHLMEKIGGFSEDRELIAAEDYDAWLRISRYTDRFLMLSGCLGYYSIGNNNISSADRTISNLHKLLNLYNSEFKSVYNNPPYWISFSLATSYYRKREKKLCLNYLMSIIKSKSSMNIESMIFKIKSVVYLLFIISLDLLIIKVLKEEIL